MGSEAMGGALWSELFLIPFLAGLPLALSLPLLGAILRLRGEWLAALAYAHVAAAGALLGLLGGLPPVVGGMAAAGVAGWGKHGLRDRLAAGAAFPLLLLGGWAVAVLAAANWPLAERLGHALFDGQLFFADRTLLAGTTAFAAVALFLLRRWSADLLLATLYPAYHRLRSPSARRAGAAVGFDLLAAFGLALATLVVGVMAAFALVFVPPWIAFRRSASWRQALAVAALLGGGAYLGAFGLALWLDQPPGPLLVLMLVIGGVILA